MGVLPSATARRWGFVMALTWSTAMSSAEFGVSSSGHHINGGTACRSAVCVGVASVALHLPGFAAEAPDGPWRPARPEIQGLSAARLDALRTDLAARRTKALLIIRRDVIVGEAAAMPSTAGRIP